MKRYLGKHLNDFRAAVGASCPHRTRLVFISLALVVATFGTVGFAQRRGEELPGQDQSLARALENHPDIVAAKAKVALAEAELYGKQMEVSRQVLGLYGGLKALDAQIATAKAMLKQLKVESEFTNNAVAAGTVDPLAQEKVAAAVQAAEGKLVEAMGQREQAEKELRLLIGATLRPKEPKAANAAAVPLLQTPQGPIVDQWKSVAERPIKISIADMPLEAVMNYLSEKSGVRFSLQVTALEDAGTNVKDPISLNTNEVPLRAALQGFEDRYLTMQFVLRDYGVLLTTKDYARLQGYVPVLVILNDPPGEKLR